MLAVRLFGAPAVEYAGRPLVLPRRKSRALVFYLAAQPHPVRRETLLSLFWPDAERAAGQQTLRTTLHGLRQALGESLRAEDDTLALDAAVVVDARHFTASLKTAGDAAALSAALELYRGEFLAGFSLPDAPAFDDWAAAERERYRRLAVRALTTLSHHQEAGAAYSAALEALERALALDPLQEDIQRAALRLHYLAGDRAGAIRRYEQLRRLLDEEMGVPPMAETRALYDAIITDTLTPAPAAAVPAPLPRPPEPEAAAPPFTGRSRELETLRGLLPGHRLALLEGEAGIGKSRLAEEFLRSAAGLGLVGAARELEQALPYQPIREALRGLLARPEWPERRAAIAATLPSLWCDEAARLLPELNFSQPAGPAGYLASAAPDEPRLWEGVLQFLTALAHAAGQRLLLFLDDLQWADASTLALVGYLVRRAEVTGAPLFILGAARPYTSRSPLAVLQQALTREGRLTRLPLSRLTNDDVISLARHLSPDFAQPLAYWLRQNSEGNPYILAELVRALRGQQILKPGGALDLTALSAEPMVPQTIYSLIQSRLARLSDPARRVLDAAVAAGREFEFEVVAHAAGLSEAAALDALDELRAAHLVLAGADPSRWRFDHSLTMEVAYREVGEPRHRLLHRRIAEALETLRRDRLESLAGVLAWHFGEGGAPERASPHAWRAGQQAAQLAAWREATAFFEQALAGADSRMRLAILTALGVARFHAGQSALATEALRLALAESRHEPAQSEAIRRVLAQTLLNQGRFADVIEEAQALLAESAAAPDWAITAELLWGTALSLEGAELPAAAEHLHRAETLLEASPQPDRARLAQAKFELGSVAAQQGDLRRALQLYEETLAVAPADDRAETWRILASNNLAYHLHLLGDPAAGAHIQRGLALAREAGNLNMLPFLLSTQGEIALAAGDLDAAEAAFTDGLALAEQLSNAERQAGLTANLGRLAAVRGEPAAAIHRLSTAVARADALGTQHLSAQIRLWLVPLLPPAEARVTLAEARALAENGGRRRLLEEIQHLESTL